MKPQRLVYAVIAPLRRRLERHFLAPKTARFLHDRQARLIIQEKHTQNYYAVRAYPVTEISVHQEQLRLQLKLLGEQSLRVIISSQRTHQPLAELTVPIRESQDTIDLHLDGTVLKLELAPTPSLDALP